MLILQVYVKSIAKHSIINIIRTKLDNTNLQMDSQGKSLKDYGAPMVDIN